MKKLLLLFNLVALLSGCAHLDPAGPYAGDKALYTADTTLVASYSVLDTFVKFEYDNRAALASQPAVGRLADDIRRHAPGWFADVEIARDAYAAHPVAANLTALQNAVHVVQAAVSAAAAEIAAHPDLLQ